MNKREINRHLDAIDRHVLRLQAAVDQLRAEFRAEDPPEPPPIPIDERLLSPRLWTVDEAAQRLGVSQRFVYQLLSDGVLRRIKIGRCTKISEDDLARYIDRLAG